MFGIGGFELFLIVMFAFLLFGPDKIPVFLKTLGKAVAKFREAEEEVSSALKQEVVNPETGETAADMIDSLTGKKRSASNRSASSESLAARRAKHEQERAAREAAAKEAAQKAAAAKEVAAQATPATSAAAEQATAIPAPNASASQTSVSAGQTMIGGMSIEELYAMPPVAGASAASVHTEATQRQQSSSAQSEQAAPKEA